MRRWLVICLMAALLLLAGCSKESTSQENAVPGLSDSTLTIGSWGPLSGPAALWGAMTHAMDAYFQLINEQGGIHGRKIRFVYKDDAYNPARTVPAVRQLVEQEEAFALIGGLGTATNMAVMDYIIEKNIPWVSPGSGVSYWAYPPKENIFSTFIWYIDEARIQVDYVLDSLQTESMALVYQNDDFGESALKSARFHLEERGLKLRTALPYEVSDRDFSTHAAILKDENPEVVLLWMAPRQAAALLAACQSLSYHPQWIAASVLSDMEQMHQLSQGAWEGVIFAYYGLMPTDSSAQLQQYREALARYHPEVRWGAFAETGFIYAEPMVAALEKAGRNLTRESFVRAMEELNGFQGIGPAFSFAPGQRQGNRSLYLLRCGSATEYEKLTGFLEGKADPAALLD
jgi:branched-chain amino acid transport system substrate-binding protein